MARIPEMLGSEYYRGFLSRQGQAFYDCINTQLLRKDYSGKTTFSISNPETSVSDCFLAYKALRDDHPEFFYLGFQTEFTRRGGIGTLEYPILYTPEIIDRIWQQVRKKICQIVRGSADLSMIERETLIYERIARSIAYTNNGDVRDHSIVGPVLLSTGVCEGKNALLLLCFRRIGIPCVKVYGRTKTDGWHCWTIAWINGIPVHCDVTWDGTEEGLVCFNYLNLSDNQISGDHYDFKCARIPVCTSEALSYYSHHGLCVHSYNDLKLRFKKDSQRSISPILIHFSYRPLSGDCLKEAQRVFSEERISGNHRLYYHPILKNLAVKKMS
jgi:hypothetical protein